jgi:hypothetical protein
LLIKDILQYPTYANTIKAAAQLIEYLHHADKQHQIFKEIQERFPSKHRVLTSPADTRWGAYTKTFQRIIENIGALRVWTQDPRIIPELKGSERAINVGRILSDITFLPKLTELEAIIYLISDAIVEA